MSRLTSRAADMAAVDALPLRLRRAVHQAAVSFDAQEVAMMAAFMGEAAALEALAQSEAHAIAATAAAYRASHGTRYPHVAVGASVLRAP